MTGETASSSKLIELLESSKLLQNAAPKGPTTRGSVPGSERFMIGGELRPRTPPEAQPVAASAKAAVPQGANAVSAPAPQAVPVPPVQVAPAPAPQGANSTPREAKPHAESGFGPFPKKQ